MAKKEDPAITTASGNAAYMAVVIVGGLILNLLVMALLGASAG